MCFALTASWKMHGSSDDEIIIMFMKARMLLTHACKESVSQARARKGRGDAEKNNLIFELVQRLLKAEKRSHESLDKLLLSKSIFGDLCIIHIGPDVIGKFTFTFSVYSKRFYLL